MSVPPQFPGKIRRQDSHYSFRFDNTPYPGAPRMPSQSSTMGNVRRSKEKRLHFQRSSVLGFQAGHWDIMARQGKIRRCLYSQLMNRLDSGPQL